MNMRDYHVSVGGCDLAAGTKEAPFRTISKAAKVAVAGDRVIVHEGEYREWVRPENGGLSDNCRIVYEAAEGEHVVIKGSEIVKNWEKVGGSVWKAVISNTLFGDYNPFETELSGDWIVYPLHQPIHLGDVYINGASIYEAENMEKVYQPEKWETCHHASWDDREEAILHPELTLYRWFAEVSTDETVLYVNFQDLNPKHELIEISVRRSCFYPDKSGVNYITVRGFEMAQAATPWAPPTADQPGLIGPHWAKGWVIENNDIHDAKCSAVSLGKEASTGDNDFTKWRRKPGYQYQMEAVFLARHMGWDKERIGSHIVRNNKIHDCGQNGIVGHMGCVFSEIYGNEIYNIAVKHEYYGYEIAGIKFHAAIDVKIHHNYIHNCSLGTWLDWEAQGVRVSSNIYDKNNRDFMVEVTHGPALVDNNIFTSEFAVINAAQGTAFVHNLCGGFMSHYPVLNRSTPYHLPHSTEVLSTTLVYGGDDRWYQNIFIGGDNTEERYRYGTYGYNGSPVSMEEYIELVKKQGDGDVEMFELVKQPSYIDSNVYLNGAKGFDREEHKAELSMNPGLRIIEDGKDVYLEMEVPEEMLDIYTRPVTTKLLGMTRLSEECYENPDGTSLVIDKDIRKEERGNICTPGPIQKLTVGHNRIKVWTKK